MKDRNGKVAGGRRDFIRAGLGLAGGIALPGLSSPAWGAENHPPIGTARIMADATEGHGLYQIAASFLLC